jgi:peptide/nickel transport system permease protein
VTDSTRPDGGVAEPDDVFGGGGGDGERAMSTYERYYRVYDAYVRAPLIIAWKDWRTRVGIPIVLLYIAAGTVFPLFLTEPTVNEGPRLLKPFHGGLFPPLTAGTGLEHDPWLQFSGAFPWVEISYPIGTDKTGKGLFRQAIFATPAMLKMALAGAVVSSGLAVVIGMISGYVRGRVDDVLMAFTDVVLTIPGLPVIVLLAAIIKLRDPFLVGFVLGIDNWPGLARNLRSQVLAAREADYVEASQSMGISTPQIIAKDVLPQMLPYTFINTAGAAGRVIKESVGLYFLGILPFTTFNWGVMLNLARQNGALAAPFELGHWLFMPAFALWFMGFGLVLMSQGMDRVFNPRLRARHRKTGADEGDELSPTE